MVHVIVTNTCYFRDRVELRFPSENVFCIVRKSKIGSTLVRGVRYGLELMLSEPELGFYIEETLIENGIDYKLVRGRA